MTFPIDLTKRPEGFEPLAREPAFDPSKHLALERPSEIYSLGDLGYSNDDIAECPSDFGATSVFRVLSDEGAACLLDVCHQLETYAKSNPRIARCVRGGVYRSKFLADLCVSEDVNDFMSELAGIDVRPHTIPHQLGHLNYNPMEIGKDVDKWHVDTLRYDYVMFVTDPTKVEGGAFQYFKGTKHEMATLKAVGKSVPAERVIAPVMPGPGYAIFQQGNMVVHQAKGLTSAGERITMVNGYVADPRLAPDFTRYDQLAQVDPEHVVTAEYARHMLLQSQGKSSAAVETGSFDADRGLYVDELEAIAKGLLEIAREIRETGVVEVEHFGA
jgi:hypothetical protein